MQNYNIKGTVKFSGKSNDEKNVCSLILTEERAAELTAKLALDPMTYEATPIKETEEGEIFFKTSSQYPVTIYENGNEVTGEISLSDIGEESEVILFVGISVTTYKRKSYQVAYLKSVNIIKLIDAVRFNPFESNEVEEI